VEDVQLGLVSGAAVWYVGFIFYVIFSLSLYFSVGLGVKA